MPLYNGRSKKSLIVAPVGVVLFRHVTVAGFLTSQETSSFLKRK